MAYVQLVFMSKNLAIISRVSLFNTQAIWDRIMFIYILLRQIVGVITSWQRRPVCTHNLCPHSPSVKPSLLWWAYVCLSVCLFVCLLAYLKKLHVQYSPNFLYTYYLWPWLSLLLSCQYIDTLCTSGFVDDVMFSFYGVNGPKSNSTHMFHRVRQMAAPGWRLCVFNCRFVCDLIHGFQLHVVLFCLRFVYG